MQQTTVSSLPRDREKRQSRRELKTRGSAVTPIAVSEPRHGRRSSPDPLEQPGLTAKTMNVINDSLAQPGLLPKGSGMHPPIKTNTCSSLSEDAFGDGEEHLFRALKPKLDRTKAPPRGARRATQMRSSIGLTNFLPRKGNSDELMTGVHPPRQEKSAHNWKDLGVTWRQQKNFKMDRNCLTWVQVFKKSIERGLPDNNSHNFSNHYHRSKAPYLSP